MKLSQILFSLIALIWAGLTVDRLINFINSDHEKIGATEILIEPVNAHQFFNFFK